jgi:energy-coupling factor transporter ATP-binding protein EcfA2
VTEAVRWISEQHEHGAVAFRVGRRRDELVAEFVGLATLFASRDGREVAFVPAPGADPVGVDKVRASLVPALLRHAAGKLTLHGAAVVRGGRAVSLVGASGSGKSTLSAELCARYGADLVADDTSALDCGGGTVSLSPTERVNWLVQGSLEPLTGNEKMPVSPKRVAAKAVTLAAVCALEFDPLLDRPVMQRLRGQEAFARLVPHVIRLVVDEAAAQLWEVGELDRLIAHADVYELRRPPGMVAQHLSAGLVASLLGAGEDDT